MFVDVHRRRVRIRFRLLCRDPYATQYATNGPKPTGLDLAGNRVGAVVHGWGMFEGSSESGFPGTQLTFWGLRGHFSGPTTFRGRIEFETATSPAPPIPSYPPPAARPQCLGRAGIDLEREA